MCLLFWPACRGQVKGGVVIVVVVAHRGQATAGFVDVVVARRGQATLGVVFSSLSVPYMRAPLPK